MKTIKRWYTISEYIDGETGEILKKEIALKEYRSLKKTKRTEIKETIINNEIINYGYITWQHECCKREQLKLF